MDSITNFSYSSFQTLDLCTRKLELEKNIPRIEKTYQEMDMEEVDFLFGHVVHTGCQSLFAGEGIKTAIWKCFKRWNAPLDLKKKSKNFWTALDAVHKIHPVIQNLLDEGWTLAVVNGKPATEISFRITFGKDIHGVPYKFRGHIDIILYNKQTGEYKVVEIKTTSFSVVDESSFANSEQSLGYSVVLDKIAPNQASYEVLYLVWKESQAAREWEVMPFIKSKSDKAEWLRNVLDRFELVDFWKKKGYFPKRGQSCFSFFRQCPFFGACNLPTAALVPKPENIKNPRKELEKYDFEFTLEEIILSQLTLADF